jgi:hypothetical protein
MSWFNVIYCCSENILVREIVYSVVIVLSVFVCWSKSRVMCTHALVVGKLKPQNAISVVVVNNFKTGDLKL